MTARCIRCELEPDECDCSARDISIHLMSHEAPLMSAPPSPTKPTFRCDCGCTVFVGEACTTCGLVLDVDEVPEE